ncbi:uncharacterized protein [Panulirus ornatus]|uniref:uncharacterized protein n=1 Tax=Panulirus ornatus TaxID=150431 RepID=UPI003A84F4A4
MDTILLHGYEDALDNVKCHSVLSAFTVENSQVRHHYAALRVTWEWSGHESAIQVSKDLQPLGAVIGGDQLEWSLQWQYLPVINSLNEKGLRFHIATGLGKDVQYHNSTMAWT